jgi:hypothetical protein
MDGADLTDRIDARIGVTGHKIAALDIVSRCFGDHRRLPIGRRSKGHSGHGHEPTIHSAVVNSACARIGEAIQACVIHVTLFASNNLW